MAMSAIPAAAVAKNAVRPSTPASGRNKKAAAVVTQIT
jgi:hypothetical protein